VERERSGGGDGDGDGDAETETKRGGVWRGGATGGVGVAGEVEVGEDEDAAAHDQHLPAAGRRIKEGRRMVAA
jgi:hypothetical protein